MKSAKQLIQWLILFSVPTAQAATITWTNTSGGDWSEAASWKPNRVPGSTDIAQITTPGTYTVTVSDDTTLAALVLGAASGKQKLDLSSGTFTLLNPGSANANATLEISGATFGGVLTLAGTIDWNGGTITGVVTCNGGTVNNPQGLNGGQLINTGTLTWIPFPDTGNGSVISNASSGTLNIQQNNDSITSIAYGGSATFYNAGQINVSGTGWGTINDMFINTGTVTVTSGTLTLANGRTNSGTITEALGATVEFSEGNFYFNSASTLTGAGTFLISGGTFENTGPVTVQNPGGFSWTGGEIDGVLYVNGGTVNNPNYLNGGRLINTGALNWIPYPYVENGAVISNEAGGTITFDTTSGRPFDGLEQGTAALCNAGQFVVSGGSGTSAATSDQFTNTGTFTVNGGTFEFDGGYNLAGGTLNFGIVNLSSFGSVFLNGTGNLAGGLSAAFNAGFVPAVGNSWQVLTYGSLSGRFASTNLPPSAVWRVTQASGAVKITVLKLVPQITWPAPAAITYGATLSSSQLNATANWNGTPVAGVFAYNPPLGTVLASGGNQVLSVTFSPTATATYTNVTTAARINVQPAPLAVTANNTSKRYGQTLNFAGTEFTTSGLVNGDSVTGATLSSPGAGPAAPVNGSPYPISVANATGNAV